MSKGLKFLGISSLIFKILAWISAIFFLVVTFIVLLGFGGETPRVASLVFLLGGAIYFLVLFTISELIKLSISISNKVDKLGDLLEGKSST